jgi:hypothetical protein
VRVSPRTVRPGRCAVVTFSAAPPGAPVTARFADGPTVAGTVGAGGGVVLSVCMRHDSGVAMGAITLLVTLASGPPTSVGAVLRVPARGEPPLFSSDD